MLLPDFLPALTYMVYTGISRRPFASHSGTWQLLADPPMARPRISPGRPTRTTIGRKYIVAGEDHLLRYIASGMRGNRAGEARCPLATHLWERNSDFKPPLSCRRALRGWRKDFRRLPQGKIRIGAYWSSG